MKLQTFKIQIQQATLDDLRARLARVRWPDEVADSGWDYGTNPAFVKELTDYWRSDFDWRAQEEEINRPSHFRADIDGLGIRLIHERGEGPKPPPHHYHARLAEFFLPNTGRRRQSIPPSASITNTAIILRR